MISAATTKTNNIDKQAFTKNCNVQACTTQRTFNELFNDYSMTFNYLW